MVRHMFFCWLGMSICYLPSNYVFLHMYINNCVYIMFKIWYITMILSSPGCPHYAGVHL
jgi:hypothetical protein